ncbi:hypothetical protein [Roseiconus lacunae]|uniref:Uncharacterized protein n=1 Tax=Roseiconus lacunae TaxID=2605694 RepID=A0ABT7PR46_9BACT|nr:hypothetical protein [Roseiconus lacunae]MDM4018962.1 hypothetical protein [Roseiconus lacunae]
MRRLPRIMTAGLLLAVACGCSDPDSGLTKTQVTQVLDIQQETQRERADLSRARDELESDRRKWSERERKDPIIAEVIGKGLVLILSCLPLVLIVLLLVPANQDIPAELIRETLIGDNRSDRRLTADRHETRRRLD